MPLRARCFTSSFFFMKLGTLHMHWHTHTHTLLFLVSTFLSLSLSLSPLKSTLFSPRPPPRYIRARYINPPRPDFNLTCAIKRDQKRISVWSVEHFSEQKCARACARVIFYTELLVFVTQRENIDPRYTIALYFCATLVFFIFDDRPIASETLL